MRVPESATRGGVLLGRPNPKLPDDIEELAQIEGARWKAINSELRRRGVPQSSGGQFYQDTRPPWLVADVTAVTLSTTMLQLWSTPDLSATYASDWFPGKIFQVRAFGRMTTSTTPGNLTIQLGYGTANGTGGALATSAALTLIASQTNISWRFEGRVRCRAVGPGASVGILLGTGIFECNTAVIAAGQALVPATAPAQVGSLNLAQTSGIHLQFARSGSTTETAQVHDMQLVAEN